MRPNPDNPRLYSHLSLDGKVVELFSDDARIVQDFGPVALVQRVQHASACTDTLQWFALDGTHSPEFGTCVEPRAARHEAGQFIVEGLGDYAIPLRFTWAPGDAGVAEQALSDLPQGPDMPLDDPAELLSAQVWPSEVLVAANWNARLLELLGDAATLRQAIDSFELSSPFREENGWAFATGCARLVCEEATGAMAVRLSDGAVLLALTEGELGDDFGVTGEGWRGFEWRARFDDPGVPDGFLNMPYALN
ncbi:MAG: hypothetical protein Q4G36_04815 [Paracoccus sp. (in: a-proteobacteria)]|nr:hypothetical protein [Paracoccus sp. (in: a-proteobacteria)]